MQFRKLVTIVAVALGLMVVPAFAQETPGTIADIVVASASGETPEFATLLAAVGAADPAVLEALSNPEAQLTVFAPTDAAFAALGEETIATVLADQALLTDILLYHVVDGVYTSEDVVGALSMMGEMQESWSLMSAGATLETLNGQSIDIAMTEEGGITIDSANLVLEMVDIQASNGVIHVIDAVLLPETRTIAEIATEFSMAETPEFSTLLTAVVAADPSVLELLSDPESELTVFAPTDAAFAALSEALGAETFAGIVADPAALTPILTYHVLPGIVSSTDLGEALTMEMMEGEEMPAWLAEKTDTGLVLNTANGATLTFTLDMENGLLLNDTVKIVMTDVDASNGVIHVIDAVLVPPSN
jgi:transforming growth factor-beta-induced protein